jgi:hypothetical protein
MPPITRRFLGTAAVMLMLGIGLGLVLLVRRELWGVWPHPGLVSAHTHLILVGAVIELIIGTAWWLFPRPARTDPQAPEGAVILAWWCLTAGTLARAAAESAPGLALGSLPWLAVGGGSLQVAGLAAAVVALRRRVRPGAAKREGEKARNEGAAPGW